MPGDMENRRRQSMLSGIFHFLKSNSYRRTFSDSLTKQLALPGFSGFRYFDYLIFRLFVFSQRNPSCFTKPGNVL